MWSEPAETTEPASTPTLALSLLSLPEPPWMPTPPRLTSASIPFLWEEAPGKPRPCTRSEAPSPLPGARTLELPPRLLNEAKQTNLPSPTTVLDGPERGGEGSKRWGSFRKCKEVVVGGASDSSAAGVDGGGGSSKVESGRLRRKRTPSLSAVSSYAKSHFLVNIYESFKQVVPWRRRPT